jgi:hypothetical protein
VVNHPYPLTVFGYEVEPDADTGQLDLFDL